MALMEKDIEI